MFSYHSSCKQFFSNHFYESVQLLKTPLSWRGVFQKLIKRGWVVQWFLKYTVTWHQVFAKLPLKINFQDNHFESINSSSKNYFDGVALCIMCHDNWWCVVSYHMYCISYQLDCDSRDEWLNYEKIHESIRLVVLLIKSSSRQVFWLCLIWARLIFIYFGFKNLSSLAVMNTKNWTD